MSKTKLTEEQRAAEIVKFADEVYKDSLAYHLKQPAAQKPEAGRSRIPGTSNEYHAERDAAALKLAEAERTEALRMAKLSQAGGADYTKIANFNALRKKMQVARSSTQRQTAFQDFLQANSMDRTNPKKGVGAAKIKEALSDKHALIQGIKSTVTNSFAGEYEAETKAVAKLQAAARQRAERKTKGATALQRVFRGHQAKTALKAAKTAATKIAAVVKGHQAKTALKAAKTAATKIAAVVKGHQAKTALKAAKTAATKIAAVAKGRQARKATTALRSAANAELASDVAHYTTKGLARKGTFGTFEKERLGAEKGLSQLIQEGTKDFKGDQKLLKENLKAVLVKTGVDLEIEAWLEKNSGRGIRGVGEGAAKAAMLKDAAIVKEINEAIEKAKELTIKNMQKQATHAGFEKQAKDGQVKAAIATLKASGVVVGSNGDSSRAQSPRSDRSAGSNMGR